MNTSSKFPLSRARVVLLLMCFSLAFNSGVRAQVGTLVNNLPQPGARECSIAVLPGGTGKILASAYCQDNPVSDATDIITSFSTNTTLTTNIWTTNANDAELNPGYDNIGNPKIAYRTAANSGFTGFPELIIVYRGYSADGSSDGVFVDFSSDNGAHWLVSPLPVESHASGDLSVTVRPSITVDNNTGNAYIMWSTTQPRQYPPLDSVYVTEILANSHTLSSPTPRLLASNGNGEAMGLDGCDITVDPNNNLFALLRHTRYECCKNPSMQLFYLYGLESGHSLSSTWTSPYLAPLTGTVPGDMIGDEENESGSVANSSIVEYDYPCLTVSSPTSGCGGTDSIFIAYSQGNYTGTSPNSSNPTDLYLASASLSSTGSNGAWNVYNIQADNAATNLSLPGYTFQFMPELCPDGNGGVFLLYYSALPDYTPTYANPTTYQRAMLYESGSHRTQTVLLGGEGASPAPNLYSVSDYIGIAWDPVQGLAHPTWTDFEGLKSRSHIIPAYEDIFGNVWTESFQGAPIGGTNSAPAIGNLGFSNQRRIVMTGSEAHLVTVGNTANSHAISYSEQTSNSNNLSNDWSTSLELDNMDGGVILSYPGVGVYRSSVSSAQNAVAVVWASIPGNYAIASLVTAPRDNLSHDYIYIRVKEFSDDCESGTLSDWSVVDSFAVSGISSSIGGITKPVVAPLTAMVIGEPNERYLIGWVVTYPTSSGLFSRTYLRGQEHGLEGSNSTTNQETENESWEPHKGCWAPYWSVPTSDPPNKLVSAGYLLSPSSFVTITSNEGNGNGLARGPLSDLTSGFDSLDIVFTGNGVPAQSLIELGLAWDVKTEFFISGFYLGECTSPYGTYVPAALDNAPLVQSYPFQSQIWLDRNPSVTITSTGQKIAAWEHLDNFTVPVSLLPNPRGVGYLGGGFVGVSQLYNKASIRVSVTNGKYAWSPIQDVWTEQANDFDFFDPFTSSEYGWLLNPSVTAFPATPLHDETGSLDKDPGGAELLFWEQDSLEGIPNIKTAVNEIHEQHFDELFEKHWDGSWTLQDPSPWGPYTGANSQRSFGVYNKGPEFHISTGNQLFDDIGLSYVHGLSYGVANTASLGSYDIASTLAGNPYIDVGALKDIGTFDTALGVQLYRTETRIKDSSMVTFKWGKVYVEDTVLDVPIREVMLHNGIPDSDWYASHDAMRDSIFSTEWFNWPVSAEIRYDRMLLMAPAGTLSYVADSMIDSVVVYDSVLIDSTITYDTIPGDSVMSYYPVVTGIDPVYDTFLDTLTYTYVSDTFRFAQTIALDSGMAYDSGYIDTSIIYDTTYPGLTTVYDTIRDTVPGTFTIDTTRRTDSTFFSPGTQIKYIVQLIHQSGHIDTVEQMLYEPLANLFIAPTTVHIANAGTADDTVMLQVLGSFTNIPDADSDVGFERETMFEQYPTYNDTTLAIGTGGGIVPPPDTCFYSMGPYSNPSEPLSDDVSILVHYCGTSSTISAQVYTMMGIPIGPPSTFTSDGQEWDRLPINAPPISGTYYITVTVGSYSTTLGYTVY